MNTIFPGLKKETIYEDMLIGSTEPIPIDVEQNCCYDHAVLNLTDLAGNSNVCHASINKSSEVKIFRWLFLFSVYLCIQ